MTKFQDNQSPYLTMLESAAPSTPASGLGYLYQKTDNKLYFKNDAGTETELTAAGSGNVATDVIWDAAGDLVQGTGANTGAKLGAGTAGQVLTSAGAAAANVWAGVHGVGLNHSADVTISNGSEIALTMDTEVFDTDGYHDTVTNNNRITIPSGLGGYYQLNINLRPNDAAGAYVVARLNVTSGGTIIALPSQQGTGPVLYSCCSSTIVNLAAGDFLWIGQQGNVGSKLFLKGTGGAQSWVSLVRLGV